MASEILGVILMVALTVSLPAAFVYSFATGDGQGSCGSTRDTTDDKSVTFSTCTDNVCRHQIAKETIVKCKIPTQSEIKSVSASDSASVSTHNATVISIPGLP